MPSPAEHYAEAERYLREADVAAEEDASPGAMVVLAAIAQVHATLATATQAAQGADLLAEQPVNEAHALLLSRQARLDRGAPVDEHTADEHTADGSWCGRPECRTSRTERESTR